MMVRREETLVGQGITKALRSSPRRSTPLIALIALGVVLTAACGDQSSSTKGNAPAPPPPPAPPTPTAISLDISYPAGFGINSAAVAAAQDITLGAGVHLLAKDGTPGAATNAGSGTLIAGANDKVGTLASIGGITIGSSTTASKAVSGGNIVVGAGAHVAAVQPNATTLVPLVHRTISAYASGATSSAVTIPANQSATLSPGSFAGVTVGANASLNLSAGVYLLDQLVVGAGAKVNLDTSGGTVAVYVNHSVSWSGTAVGDPANFILGTLGNDPMTLSSGFSGTALAPSGTLTLGSSSTTYRGTFYGKHVTVGANVTIQEEPTPFLLDSLTVDKTTVCIGEQASVKISGGAFGAGVTPWIQGVVGDHQTIDFGGDFGSRIVVATAFADDGRADFTSTNITVKDCGTPAVTPITLHFWGSRTGPDVVDFSVDSYGTDGIQRPPSQPATYVWTFGDGQTLTTATPVVEHDYSARVNHLAPFTYFDASVTVTTSSGTVVSKKTIPVWSLYAANRAKGYIQPPNAVATTSSGFQLIVKNYESTPLSMTQAKVERIPCDPALDAVPLPLISIAATIQANSSGTVSLAAPPPVAGICALGIHLFGTTAAGEVRTDSYLRIGSTHSLTSQPVTDSATIALLNHASTLTADPNRFTETELQALVNRGALSNMPPAVPPGAVYDNVGDECDPDGSTPPKGLVCEPTTDWTVEPAQIMNAFKGNFVMDHGCGSIGQLLAAAGQLYSHDSIVVKNRVEVRHSTMSEDLISDHLLVAEEKIDSDVLQFGWPGSDGTATHSISEMTGSYFITDPDHSTYRMGLEFDPTQNNVCRGDITAVPPIVVRPDPKCSPQPNLQPVVDNATGSTSHYRFFMYSHADEPRSCTTGWCSGNSSTVCSSFARNSAADASLPLWPSQKDHLGERTATDGMDHYMSNLRMAGANAEYSLTYDNVRSKSWPADFVIPLPAYSESLAENLGNQLTNCFASDSCDDTSFTWRAGVGDGNAVSPDNIKSWDSCYAPTGGTPGTYGYNEPAVYVPAAFRHRYTLQKAAGTSSITVSVVDQNNAPVPNATITLDGNPSGTPDAAGTLFIDSVPEGGHDVGAQEYLATPPPDPYDPTPDEIVALPRCTAGPPCQAPAGECPLGWISSTTVALSPGIDPGGAEFYYVVGCNVPTTPASCDVITADRVTNVGPTNDTVTLTFCNDSACESGVRATCANSCTTDNDCDDNQHCVANKCAAAPRLVRITDASISGIVSGGCDCTTLPNAFTSLDITCDPTSESGMLDYLCDAGHLHFCTTPITGGRADKTVLLNGNGDCNALVFHFVCTMDPLGTGGVIIGSDMRLLDGCSPGSDEANAREWTSAIVPATSSDPISLACAGGAQTTTATGLCDPFSGEACWHNGVTACSDCCDNEATLGPSGLTYTSIVHP